MQLPFSFVIELPSPANLRHTARTWRTSAIAPGIAAASAGGVGANRLEAQQGTEGGGAVCQVNGLPAAATVKAVGQVRASVVRGLVSLGISQLEYWLVRSLREASR